AAWWRLVLARPGGRLQRTVQEPDESVVTVAADRERVEEQALVLAAAGIPHAVEAAGSGWRLVVPARYGSAARGALTADEGKVDRPVPDYGPSSVGVIVAAALIIFYAATGPRAPSSRWFDAGSAVAGRIRSGEVWRTVTAL